MPKMTAAEAAVRILELEGVRDAFGVPGAAIQSVLCGDAPAQYHWSYAGPPCGGRVPYGWKAIPAAPNPAT